jgi:hypothetical protein
MKVESPNLFRPGRSALPWATVLGVVLLAGPVLAQSYPVGYPNGLSVDGNIFWGSGANTSLASQASGAPTAALIGVPPTFAQPCPTGYNASVLITNTFVHNQWTDPLLNNVVWPNGNPDFQPSNGSPAYVQAMKVPDGDAFFQQTCYVGAVGPAATDRWWEGWTYFDSLGTGRDDLHLPGMTNPRPALLHDNVTILIDQTWGPDFNHVVRGQCRVAGGANLTILPGTIVIEERATLGTIRIDRGSKIFAEGTRDSVIIITTDDAPGTMHTGGCGGLVINGRGKVNNANSCAGDSAASEGGAIGFYGGNDDHDSSGRLKYVRIEYSGKEITPNNELNTFTNNAVGDGTYMEYLQAHQGADDGWEAFGGTVRVKHLICTDGHDDGYDWQQGYRGGAQFVIVRGIADLAPSGTQFGDKAIEADNNDVAPFDQDIDAHLCSGQSNPIVYNATFIGDRSRSGAAFPGSTFGVNLRRGTAGVVMNSIVANFKTVGLRVDDDVTWKYHCRALNTLSGAGPLFLPSVFCSAEVGGVPVGEGRILLLSGAPNPFRRSVDIAFTLPQSGRVRVEVYTADGRLVSQLADQTMAAGRHTLTWRTGAETPSGVYFYRVTTHGRTHTGKVVRVD